MPGPLTAIDHLFERDAQALNFRRVFVCHRFGHQIRAGDHDSATARIRARNFLPSRAKNRWIRSPHIGLSPVPSASNALKPPGKARLARAVHDQALIEFRNMSSPKICLMRLRPVGERVDLLRQGIQGERGACGARDAEPSHQRLRAMMPGAHGDALAVQQGGDVMGMRLTMVNEITPPGLAPGRECSAPQGSKHRQRMVGEEAFMFGDGVEPDRLT